MKNDVVERSAFPNDRMRFWDGWECGDRDNGVLTDILTVPVRDHRFVSIEREDAKRVINNTGLRVRFYPARAERDDRRRPARVSV
jgi:hypothetical protein